MEPDSESSPLLPHVELKAVALLVLTLALIGGFLGYVMYARGVFESTQRLYLVADDSEGVLVGMDITFAGFPIGRVQRIELAEDGKARIVIDVPRKDAHWLRSSTVFTMERGMVGETRIRAFSAVLEDPPLADGAARPVLRGDVSEQIPRLVSTMRSLLENLERMTGENSSLNTSLGNVHTVTERMKGRYGALAGALGGDDNARKVLAAVDRTNALLARTDGLLAKTDARVFGAGGAMDETQQAIVELNAILRAARESLKKADAVLVEAQAIGANTRAATTDLGALRAEVETSLRQVGHLVEEINRKWPFARDTELKLP